MNQDPTTTQGLFELIGTIALMIAFVAGLPGLCFWAGIQRGRRGNSEHAYRTGYLDGLTAANTSRDQPGRPTPPPETRAHHKQPEGRWWNRTKHDF